MLKDTIQRAIWQKKEPPVGWRGNSIFLVKILYAISQKFQDRTLTLQTTSLVYTTLLSLAPLLAITFSVLKGFGAHNSLAPLLADYLQPLGIQGEELAGRIIHFIENIRVTTLGSLGVALLFFTVVSMITQVEIAVSKIWHFKHRRSLLRQFGDYFSILIVGMVFLLLGMGFSASVMKSETALWLLTSDSFAMCLAIPWKRPLF